MRSKSLHIFTLPVRIIVQQTRSHSCNLKMYLIFCMVFFSLFYPPRYSGIEGFTLVRGVNKLVAISLPHTLFLFHVSLSQSLSLSYISIPISFLYLYLNQFRSRFIILFMIQFVAKSLDQTLVNIKEEYYKDLIFLASRSMNKLYLHQPDLRKIFSLWHFKNFRLNLLSFYPFVIFN